jgi:tRNA(Arg) A34 adenosine deaminase TadA
MRQKHSSVVAGLVRALLPPAVLISSMGVPSSSSGHKAPKSKARSAQAVSTNPPSVTDHDLKRMSALVNFTARSLSSPSPRPFGAAIVHTRSGELLLRALNAVMQEFDPSSHAEVRAIRKAAKRLRTVSLAGYTLYTTCEPCPMCMSAALWAGLDRVVFGATLVDANRHCNQIHIPATEVNARSDMKCVVVGPVVRDQCYALFTHPNMLRAFRLWSSRGRK